MQVLIVDDEAPMRELVRLHLERAGFAVIEASGGRAALAKLETESVDLVVLDLMMDDLDGWEVCRRIRAESELPILMLTARGETFDRVAGLELGADDYLVKPFDGRELVARCNAILRRGRPQPEEGSRIRRGPLVLDEGSRTAMLNGQPLPLTPKEFDLLLLLANHPGQVFSRDRLLDSVWGYEFAGAPRSVDTHVKNLREKLGEASGLVQTVWGHGYRFETR
ncbi:MAG TPA: response regulator transcription factor [Symbiobacteriaceae bacterium]|nr:response regulator transcription factor [Symbiobacteriaceae bacterium]